MHIEVCESNVEHRAVILNLGVYYRYDLLPFIDAGAGSKLNSFGTISDDDAATTHEQGIADQAIWWTKPGVLLPMLIRCDGEPAGFAQVARPPHAHRSVDYRMEDLFIVNAFRRAGVGRTAVAEIFARLPGRWEIGWLAKNRSAESFWRSIAQRWNPEDWPVEQAPGTPSLPGLRFNVSRI